MDDTETLALKYLESLNLGPITFEPDGNIPPDFAIDRRIAVEVRRLNEHWISPAGEVEGLENDLYAIDRLIRSLTDDIGRPTRGESWFVTYRFSRPLLPWSDLKRAIREYLVHFRDGRIQSTEYSVGHSFHLALFRASQVHPTCFLMGGASDEDSGGFVARLLKENIEFCIKDKGRKISVCVINTLSGGLF